MLKYLAFFLNGLVLTINSRTGHRASVICLWYDVMLGNFLNNLSVFGAGAQSVNDMAINCFLIDLTIGNIRLKAYLGKTCTKQSCKHFGNSPR